MKKQLQVLDSVAAFVRLISAPLVEQVVAELDAMLSEGEKAIGEAGSIEEQAAAEEAGTGLAATAGQHATDREQSAGEGEPAFEEVIGDFGDPLAMDGLGMKEVDSDAVPTEDKMSQARGGGGEGVEEVHEEEAAAAPDSRDKEKEAGKGSGWAEGFARGPLSFEGVTSQRDRTPAGFAREHLPVSAPPAISTAAAVLTLMLRLAACS